MLAAVTAGTVFPARIIACPIFEEWHDRVSIFLLEGPFDETQFTVEAVRVDRRARIIAQVVTAEHDIRCKFRFYVVFFQPGGRCVRLPGRPGTCTCPCRRGCTRCRCHHRRFTDHGRCRCCCRHKGMRHGTASQHRRCYGRSHDAKRIGCRIFRRPQHSRIMLFLPRREGRFKAVRGRKYRSR